MDSFVRRVVGVARGDQVGEVAERLGRLGSEPGDLGEAGDARQPVREGRPRGEQVSQLSEEPFVDLRHGHEREEQRDVSRDAVLGGPVVLRAPLADERLGLGDDDDQRGARHAAQATLTQ